MYLFLPCKDPQAINLWAQLAGEQVRKMPSFTYGHATVDGAEVSFGRTGYTGEDGFEILSQKMWSEFGIYC